MKKLTPLIVVLSFSASLAHADGWGGRGWHREGWGGWHREGWRGGWVAPALGAALVGGMVGSALAQRPPVYMAPAVPMMGPPPVYMYAPVYAAPPVAYVQPGYPVYYPR